MSATGSFPRGSDRNAVTTAWKCPWYSSLTGRRNGASNADGDADASPTTRELKRANSRSGVNDNHSRTAGKSKGIAPPRAGERRKRAHTRPVMSAAMTIPTVGVPASETEARTMSLSGTPASGVLASKRNW